MGTTIQPLVAEEIEHRRALAAMFQRRTLAQLKTAAEQYRADQLEELPDYDAASAAQCLVEMGRRGEWTENALAYARGFRMLVEYAADFTDAELEKALEFLPRAGFTSEHTARRVHIIRAEQWLRANEASLAVAA